VAGLLLAAGFHLLAGASTVLAHDGLAAGQNPLTAWNTNPIPSFGLILAAYLYLTGLSRWNRPTHPISRWQKTSFFAGLVVIFIALQSPIDAIAGHMFSFHQFQHILIRMVAPLLILGGAPLTPMLRGLPPWALLGVVRPIVSNPLARSAYYRLTNPVVATLIFLVVLYLWQVPVNMNLALRNSLVHEFMHATMMFSGFLFYWLVIDPKPHRSRMHYGLRVLYLGLIVIPNTMLGVALVFANAPLYSAYVEAGQLFGISAIDDQQIGGLMLWVPGDMMSILAAGIVMILWYQKEEEQSAAEAAAREAEAKDLPG
jgi:putative membrane protein